MYLTDILIDKLQSYGFTDDSISLLNSYLSNRQQFVVHNGKKSKTLKINFGVPQGSVLGPVLFLIYINDFPNSIAVKAIPILFAGDTNLTISNNSIDDVLNEIPNMVESTENWFSSNNLCLNETKTETMIFSLRNLGDITNPEAIRFLGVYLDSKLSWEKHTFYVCSKISKCTYLLRNLVGKVSLHTLITAYHSLIHSCISYAILVWDHSISTVNVFSAQRKAIRVITGLKYRENSREQFTRTWNHDRTKYVNISVFIIIHKK